MLFFAFDTRFSMIDFFYAMPDYAFFHACFDAARIAMSLTMPADALMPRRLLMLMPISPLRLLIFRLFTFMPRLSPDAIISLFIFFFLSLLFRRYATIAIFHTDIS